MTLSIVLSYLHTDTTDLQRVHVDIAQGNATATIQVTCDYILGSDAQGCMVMLVGESKNTTINIARDDECTIKTLPLVTTLSDVFGFDIEYDGSVGTLAIPGTISAIADIPLCLSLKNATIQNSPAAGPGKFRGICYSLHCINIILTLPAFVGMPWIILGTFIAVIAFLIVANTAFIIVFCYIRRYR
jgi:hypothetical protein